MSKRCRYWLIALNLAGVAMSWVLPSVLLALHDTVAYSTLVEFHSRGIIDKQALEEWKERPGEEDYSPYERMKDIGGLHVYFPVMSSVLTVVFSGNIACVLLLRQDRKPSETT